MKMDVHYLAKKIHLPGYTFTIRSALGGTDGGSCLQQLRHFFLTCSASGKNFSPSRSLENVKEVMQVPSWHTKATCSVHEGTFYNRATIVRILHMQCDKILASLRHDLTSRNMQELLILQPMSLIPAFGSNLKLPTPLPSTLLFSVRCQENLSARKSAFQRW